MKYKHYAPKTKCVLVSASSNQISTVNELIAQNVNCCVVGFLEDRKYINIPDHKFICL